MELATRTLLVGAVLLCHTTTCIADRIGDLDNHNSLDHHDYVVAKLAEIRDGYRNSQKPFSSYRRTGFCQPGHRNFVETVKNGRARFEIEYDDSNKGRVWVYRLDRGDAFFKIDLNSVIIHAIHEKELMWLNLSSDVSSFTSPLFEGESMNVASRCQWLLDLMNGTGDVEDSKRLFDQGVLRITLSEPRNLGRDGSDNRIVVAISSKNLPVDPVLRMTIDASKGFQLVEWIENNGAEDPKQWRYSVRIKNKYRNHGDGVWALSKGWMEIMDQGTAAENSGRPPRSVREVRVESIEMGDLDVAPEFFTLESIPILPGSIIEDYRHRAKK